MEVAREREGARTERLLEEARALEEQADRDRGKVALIQVMVQGVALRLAVEAWL